MLRRIGVFFLLVGSIITFIFFPSGSTNFKSMTWFCIGVPLVILGFTLWFRSFDRTPSTRFRLLRKRASKEKTEQEGQ